MKSKDQQLLEEAYDHVPPANPNDIRTLLFLKSLVKSYFHPDLQNNETPMASQKRQTLKQQILKLVEN